MDETRSLPSWVERLRAPVWVCDAEQRIVYAGERARAALGWDDDVLGRPCHEVVAGVEASGAPFCRPDCPVQRLAREGRELDPFLLRLPTHSGDECALRWHLVCALPLDPPSTAGNGPPDLRESSSPGEPWIVHLAFDVERFQRMERYLRGLVDRERPASRPWEGAPLERLTLREQEVLEGLASGLDSHALAVRLHVSYATVRNHVQRLLSKLGAHSIAEAVAEYLLAAGEEEEG